MYESYNLGNKNNTRDWNNDSIKINNSFKHNILASMILLANDNIKKRTNNAKWNKESDVVIYV